jgi:hypothetical protein
MVVSFSYGFGPARSRSERVRILLEELLVCVSAPDWDRGGKSGVFLIGHSQGGAASAQVSDRMHRYLRIQPDLSAQTP